MINDLSQKVLVVVLVYPTKFYDTLSIVFYNKWTL